RHQPRSAVPARGGDRDPAPARGGSAVSGLLRAPTPPRRLHVRRPLLHVPRGRVVLGRPPPRALVPDRDRARAAARARGARGLLQGAAPSLARASTVGRPRAREAPSPPP